MGIKRVKDKRQRIPFGKYTLGGRVSVLMALVSIVLFIIAIVIATIKKGNAGTEVGILGLLTLIIALAGFFVGIFSYKEENKFLRYSWIGTLANMAIWLIMLGIILIFL